MHFLILIMVLISAILYYLSRSGPASPFEALAAAQDGAACYVGAGLGCC